jgi:hypothetical protein
MILTRTAQRLDVRSWLKTGARAFASIPWRKVRRTAAVVLAVSLIGLILGFATVLLPPMFSIAFTALPIPLLLWAAPELRRVPVKSLRRVFYALVFVEICVPVYYTVQLPGLPWISVRRAVVSVLIFLFAVTIAGSSKQRKTLSETLKANKALYFCLTAYYISAALSVFTSKNAGQSISQLTEWTMNWFIPGLCCALVMRSNDDIRGLLRLIGALSLFVTALGVIDFLGQRNYAIAIMPGSLVSSLMASNPSFADMVNASPFRNGFYRASSIFNVTLSYGEFVAMVAPLGAYFIFHGDNLRERTFGAVVVLGVLTSLFVSGARGGSIAFLASMPVFIALWIARAGRMNPRSMIVPLGGAFALSGLVSVIGLIFAWGRLRVMIFGGGMEAYSDAARWDQVRMAVPQILANPITGHGIGNAADVVGYYSPGGKLTLDSSILTLLVETGVPGFLFYTGALAFATWSAGKRYVIGRDRDSALGAALACSFIAYAVYRLVLNQRENQPLLFILFGATFVFLAQFAKALPDVRSRSSEAIAARTLPLAGSA